MIVNANNPLTAITKDQVVGVYSGATATWKDLGWEDHAITVVSKEEGRSTLELFQQHFGLKDKIMANAVIIGPNGQAITTVAGNPYAIAYVSIGSAAVAESQGTAIRRLALDGVVASVENVANGTYPLMRPLNLVSKGPPAGRAKEFVDFILSPDGQAIVRREDFVPVGNATPTP
jgi:phosphate transport system substrate-binding protein